MIAADGGQVLPDGGTTTEDGGVDAGTPVGCLPNLDGRIDRSEVFFQSGLRATFKISGAATFDTAGTAATDGGRVWDFTAALATDNTRLVETKPVPSEYLTDFPDAGYVTQLSQSSDLLGVFAATNDGLYLQGVVSPVAGTTTSTKLAYTPWVKVLQFPLQAGASWSTATTVSGKYYTSSTGQLTIGGTFGVAQTESYQMNVDAVGEAKTPFASFPALRVRSVMSRTINFIPTLTLRSFTWNTECFGTVASVTGKDNGTTAEFTDVAEVRRLSP